MSERLLAELLDCKKGVAELLAGLPCVAHSLLLLYREHKTRYVTGQLYHDMQATIRGVFYVIA
ncbi:unnamed protein product [Sphacelaria rigidula]